LGIAEVPEFQKHNQEPKDCLRIAFQLNRESNIANGGTKKSIATTNQTVEKRNVHVRNITRYLHI